MNAACRQTTLLNKYSQNNEQEIILQHFGDRIGRFLDIGAFTGPDLSNVWALLETGWSGVLVEPDPFNLVKLIEHARPFCKQATIVCAGLGPRRELIRLRMDETEGRRWASSFVPHNPGVVVPSHDQVMVPVLPISDILSLGPFDFISIDAEWMDFDILKSLTHQDLDGCRMIIIETGGEERQLFKDVLNQLAFSVPCETPENIIAVRT